MNNVIIFFSTLLLLLFHSSTLKAQSSKFKTVTIQTEIYCDHCYQCESCDQNIYDQIKRNTKGVRKIKTDGEKNTIEVSFNSEKTSLDEIEKAISLAGFKANDREAVPQAYLKLDPCCRKK